MRTETVDYQTFIKRKSQIGNMSGFEPLWMPDFLITVIPCQNSAKENPLILLLCT